MTSCERWIYYAIVQKKTVEKNNLDSQYQLYTTHKTPTALLVGEECGDVPEHVHVLVSELFDEGLLGLGFLPALQHLKTEVLRNGAVIVPSKAAVYAQVPTSTVHCFERA